MSDGATISAIMIIKDEEEHLARCLASIGKSVNEIVIVDTGSKDRSIEIAKAYGAKVFEHPWENHFSKHRNQSVQYATGDWLFQIDADEELVSYDGSNLGELVKACEDVDAILVTLECKMRGGGCSIHNSLRIFKNHPSICYKGRVHNEVIGIHSARHMPIKLVHYGYDVDENTREKKSVRTVNLLLQDVQDNPEDPRPHHYLGISFFGRRKYQEAIKEAETALQLCKAHRLVSDLYSGSYYVASSAYLELGRLDKAQHWATEALKHWPHHLDSLFNMFRISFEKQDFPLFWKYVDGYFNVLGKIETSVGHLGTMIVYTIGLRWLAYFYEGCVFLEEGRTKEGEKAFRFGLANCVDKAHYHHLLAGFYRRRRDFSRAEHELKKALEKRPSGSEVIWDLAQLYKEQGDLNNEKKWLERLTKLKPTEKKAYFDLGLVYLKTGEVEKAASSFETLLKDDETNLDAKKNLALCMRKLRHFDEAVKLCLEIMEEDAKSLEALSHVAHTYYEMGNREEAVKYFEAITWCYPKELDAPVYLAQLHLLNQDVESCVACCDQILRILGLKRDIVLHSMEDLGRVFNSIATNMLATNRFYLSNICSKMGQALAPSRGCPD